MSVCMLDLLSTFLDIWNTVLVTVMFLSIYSIVGSICGSDSIDYFFFSLWLIFSYSFACVAIFDWMPDIGNIAFLAPGHFFVFLQVFLSFVLRNCYVTWK